MSQIAASGVKYHPDFIALRDGEMFGKWTVRKYLGGSTYLCECVCGVLKEIASNSLKSGARDAGCKRCVAGVPEGFADLYSTYKCNARVRGIDFQLSQEDALILVRLPCRYCQSVPARFGGIDRVDNTVGYLLANCAPCCALCNHMKCDLTVAEFLEHVRRLVGVNVCHK